MIWAIKRYSIRDSIGDLYLGDCHFVKNANRWLHLLINALSTLLLGSSNYCMQLLVSPTPSELQKAHKKNFLAGYWSVKCQESTMDSEGKTLHLVLSWT